METILRTTTIRNSIYYQNPDVDDKMIIHYVSFGMLFHELFWGMFGTIETAHCIITCEGASAIYNFRIHNEILSVEMYNNILFFF